MPRFAFAMPLLPDRAEEWRALAAEIPVRRAQEHRAFLLDRGIFKERWWLQTGPGSPPLTLVLWDCDDVERVAAPEDQPTTDHERWFAKLVLGQIHGRDATNHQPPRPEVLSGTTTKATATAGSQTMFALPLPAEGIPTVRGLVDRIEHGDLSDDHQRFLVDAGIREEWIWLQAPMPGCPALLLFHWIGDDLDGAWQRLTFVRDDPYARVLHEALFTRLIGIPPEQVAGWAIDQVLAMHVRRSDARDGTDRLVARRFMGAVAGGQWPIVERLLARTACLVDPAGVRHEGAAAVAAALQALTADGTGWSVTDVLIGEGHALGLLHARGRPSMPLLATIPVDRITDLQVLLGTGV